MSFGLGRREFMTALGSAAAWPLAARAQRPAIPMVGYLSPGSPETTAISVLAPFRKGLSEAGYVERRNLAIEYRWAYNDIDQLPQLAADLVRRQVSVIAALGSTPAALAAKAASATVPIVFENAGDPVQLGLVASLNRPGGNVTGITSLNVTIGAKRFGILNELKPGGRFGLLVNPNNQNSELAITELRRTGAAIDRRIEIVTAVSSRDIDSAFSSLVQKRIDALLVGNDTLFLTRRVQVVALAIRHSIPTMFYSREWCEAGGLMSYGTNLPDLYRQAGIYTARVLKGEKPADLPVMQAARFEFVINLQIARTLGIDVPASLLAQADEVIE